MFAILCVWFLANLSFAEGPSPVAQVRGKILTSIFDENFDPRSIFLQEKSFSFFESCEPMRATVFSQDPFDLHTRRITVEIRRPRGLVQPRRVLVLPPTGGVNYLDRVYGEYLCESGIESWLLTEWDRGQADHLLDLSLESHDLAAAKAVLGVRLVVNHMQPPVGLLGTSASALVAVVALAVDPNIQAGVLIVGGAGMADILADSSVSRLVDLKARRMGAFGWTEKRYRRELKKKVVIGPENFLDRLGKKKVGTIVSLGDRSVPTRNQLLMEQLAKAQRLGEFEDDHFFTILYSALGLTWKITEFFEENLL